MEIDGHMLIYEDRCSSQVQRWMDKIGKAEEAICSPMTGRLKLPLRNLDDISATRRDTTQQTRCDRHILADGRPQMSRRTNFGHVLAIPRAL